MAKSARRKVKKMDEMDGDDKYVEIFFSPNIRL